MQHSATTETVPETEIRLFRHSKRPQWGVAALVWERDGKRGYQFSDGKLRVFKEGYYGLFQSALPPGDGSAKAVRRLARLAHSEDVTEATRLPTLRDQIALFKREFPEGFGGKAWRSKHRGEGVRKRLKRHRDPAIADAQLLSAEALDDAIARSAWDEVVDAMIKVASGCDLIASSHMRKLKKVKPSRGLSYALREWLHGETEDEETLDHDRRFNALVRELGDAGTWPVVTGLAALVNPGRHTCVRTSAYVLQGKMLLSAFEISRRPIGSDYRRLCHVAHTVRRELEEAGLEPSDLLDVYDFIWLTLRPAARDDLLTVPLVQAKVAEKTAAGKKKGDKDSAAA